MRKIRWADKGLASGRAIGDGYGLATAIGIALLTASPAALAYVGPGLGLGVLGVIAAFVMSIFLALVSIVWYPLKRMFKKKGAEKREARQTEQTEQPQESR